MVNIMIVDDHLIVREGIRLILETEERYEVVGEAENGQQALDILQTVTPDVILLDLNMPILDGLNLMKKLQNIGMTVPIIILTTYKEKALLAEAVSLGASSYLLKDTGREKLFATIDAAIRGETLLQPDMLQLLMEAQAEKHAPKLFTDKELVVLKALARGLKNSEIAMEMHVAERTVKSYLTTIYSKLGVKTRAQAIVVAMEKSYI
ncbi:response regulator transcription factor [Kurthia massiliensis]|uniref:response regulator transcription factor n=1 Tax=Kurthia massiliensis TaxID=1033739 RepID=UPI00028946D4|nr:response regulator transcription factor [Kurthia massiliensis]